MKAQESILVIDDESSVTGALAVILGDAGYQVLTADAVAQAMSILDTGNRSASSNSASATTLPPLPADVTPPSTPANLTAIVSSTNAIDLSWTASSDDFGVTGYRVFRDSNTTPIATVTGTTFSDLGQLGSHSYQVAAIDAAGNQSGLSNMVIASVSIPDEVQLIGLSVSPTTVTAPTPSAGTVTLSGAAPAGGISVSLRSSETRKATVPATVTVPEGATSATFVITTRTGDLGGGINRVTITATHNGVSSNATLNILRP